MRHQLKSPARSASLAAASLGKRRVALAFPIGLAYLERVVRGIMDYARQRANWAFTRIPESLSPSIRWLKHWPGDGAFVLVTTVADAHTARALKFPVVNLAGHLTHPGAPTVTVDYQATGQLAADHLLERRFRRFGFYGTRGKWFSEERRNGFRLAVEAAGGECRILEVRDFLHPRSRWTDQEAELANWLRQLQPPVGIFASTDLRAVMVLNACHRLGLRVPEDVALIGVDNDIVACESCDPPLSSVSRNDWQVGWQAATMLDQLMANRPAPVAILRVQPDGVAARRSTETLAVEDPRIAAVVRYISQHLDQPFGVERLLEEGGLPRRQLERRFRQCLDCSPYEFINRQRVECAQHWLAQPGERSLTRIAALCGFRELRRFRLVFRKLIGQSPASYRRMVAAVPPTAQPGHSSL